MLQISGTGVLAGGRAGRGKRICEYAIFINMGCSDYPEIEGAAMPAVCGHISQIRDVKPSATGCEDCLKTGDTWVHLRICLQCGHVGCCDSSKNRHATKHYQKSGHPIMQSLQPGESWRWCYVDQVYVE